MTSTTAPRCRRTLAALALAVTVGATATGCLPTTSATADEVSASTTAPGSATEAVPAPQPSAGSALEALGRIEVKGRAPMTGYDRDRFGAGWVDTDRNGCDTRNDVLARDLTDETFKPGTRDCVVLGGLLADPYSATTIVFQRGQDTSDDVQIDHVVALSDAWQKGAQQLDDATRAAFANDPLNLLAVDGPLNMAKGDSDAASWLPPNKAFRCSYVARQVAVKAGYGLWMTRAEADAVAGVLAGCPGEPLPSAEPPAPGPAPAVSYENCDAVRAAGAAPIERGDPGWQADFDRDGNGVGCE